MFYVCYNNYIFIEDGINKNIHSKCILIDQSRKQQKIITFSCRNDVIQIFDVTVDKNVESLVKPL